jgi:hypothetical protein
MSVSNSPYLKSLFSLSKSRLYFSDSNLKAVTSSCRKNYHNHAIRPKKLVRDVRLSLLQGQYEKMCASFFYKALCSYIDENWYEK